MQRAWRLEHRRGSAAELHERAASDHVEGRTVVVQEVTGPALVIGSTQDVGGVAVDRLVESGIELVRRRSGGGAVLLRPEDHVWVDLVVGAEDPLAEADVERATWWVGAAWAAALVPAAADPQVRAPRADVHVRRRGLSDRDAGRVACFAAVGPGEVVVDGRKVLGISQRRTRTGTRFQCVAYRVWDPELLGSLLVGPPPSVGVALAQRAAAAVGPRWSVVEDLLPVLP